jgi:hypothetical protein
MTKSLTDLLGNIKNVHELSSDELSAMAQEATEADEAEDFAYARNNALSNEMLDTMFQRGDLKPSDAVEVACMMIVKMIIGNAEKPEKAADMLSGCINLMVGLITGNIHQLGKEDRMHSHIVKDGKITGQTQKRKDLQ